MEETKKWYQSRTIWGVIVSGICKVYLVARLLLKFSGIDLPLLPEGFEQVLTDAIVVVASFVGDIIAIIGRIKAEKRIE